MILLNWVNSRLRNAMLASIALPLLIATGLGGIILFVEISSYREARFLEQKVELITSLSAAIHEQQKERGATSIFLNSRGQSFGEELAAQRLKTDVATNALEATIVAANLNDGTLLSQELAIIVEELSRRPGIRRSVDALDIELSAALGHYTKHNSSILRTVSLIATISKDSEVMLDIMSLEALMMIKEYAGIERAIGSGAFASGEINVGQALRLGSLIARQDVGSTLFHNMAEEADIALVDEVLLSDEVKPLLEMREVLFNAVETGDLQGIAGPDFFAVTSARIDGLKKVQDSLSREVVTIAHAHAVDALMAIIFTVTAVVVAFGFSIMLTRYSIKRMLKSVRAISDAGDKLAKGDQNAQLPKDSPAELGRIVWSIDFFRRSVIEGQEREAENLERTRLAEAEAREKEEKAQLAEKQRAEADALAAREEQERAEVCAAEMSTVVAACATGDFSQRLSLEDKEGALGEMSAGINRISEVVEGSLNEVRRALSHLAKGDMTYKLTGSFEGIFADIANAMSEANTNMANTIAAVVGSASTVSESAMEISGTTNDLAKRSERNAATLQQTTKSINDISSAINTAAEAAQSAQTNVVEVSRKASEGTVIAENTMRAMQNIQESSDGISRILGVIDEIAFQTNLLALNAGVEAARAGEAGRGFAVVASEVRGLALRSSDSSSEITQLIDAATQSISQGVEMVDQTVGSLTEIAGDLQDVESQIAQMTGSFQETKRNVNEVSSSTASLDETTQETAAMLEEANAAVQSLDHEAQELSNEVSTFRISDDAPKDAAAA